MQDCAADKNVAGSARVLAEMWSDVTVEAVTVQDHAVETIGTPNLRKGPWGFRLQGLPAGPAGSVTVRLVVNFNDHFLSQLIKVGVWLLVPSCASGYVRASNTPKLASGS